MANADVLKKLKAEAGKNSVGTGKTLFNSLKVAYLGVPEKQHFPKLKNSDGSKKVVEKGWFTRGTKLMITGFRRDDMFVAKTYKNTPTHQIYKILNVEDNGDVLLTHTRYGQEAA